MKSNYINKTSEHIKSRKILLTNFLKFIKILIRGFLIFINLTF